MIRRPRATRRGCRSRGCGLQAAGQLPAPPAGGLAGGLAGAGVGELLGNATAGVFAGAAAGGAVASTIMGGDPGIGALYAVAAAGLAYSFPQVRAQLAKYQKYLDNKTRQTVSAMAQA